MNQQFLHAAKEVLSRLKKPLSITDIVKYAESEGLLSTKGKTPINTMRARLSEHIRKEKENSVFIRIGPNKFALREWDVKEYKAKPFIKNYENEYVVCVKQTSIDEAGRFFGFDKSYKPYLNLLKVSNNIQICKRTEANSSKNLKQLISYVILKNTKGEYLSYVRGGYSAKDDLLKGVLCLGFGGHVDKKDYLNLFGSLDGGLHNAAVRETAEELKGIIPQRLRLIGVINDDSSTLGYNHFAFVFEAILPSNFEDVHISREMSINQLKLLNLKQIKERFFELEFWSQLLVKEIIKKHKKQDFILIKDKKKLLLNGPIIIVGEIGSGKSEISNFISKKYQIPLILTRNCVAEIIGETDFGQIEMDRKEFQEKANKLVSHKNGIYQLANNIISKIAGYESSFIVIDGIRNVETYELIKKQYSNSILIFIEVPRDIAFGFYKHRSKSKVTVHDFKEAREHSVEKDVILFKSRADVYIFNGGSLENLYKKFKSWWDEKN